MDRLKALGRGTQLMFIASVLLLIISFFNWQEVSFDLGPIARVAARMAAVDVPIPLSFATTSFVLGVLIAVLTIVKNLTDNYSTWASYVGVVLAILVAVGAWLEVQDAGGLETLKSDASSLGGSMGGGGAAAAASAPAAPAPPAPPVESSAPRQATESAPSAAPDAGGVAAEEVSDAADQAADATSDEPSNEQGV
jgi:hypothetical protein